MSKFQNQLKEANDDLFRAMLRDLHETLPPGYSTEDPVVRATRLALEMTTPQHAGYPAEHPDYGKAAGENNLGIPSRMDPYNGTPDETYQTNAFDWQHWENRNNEG